MLKNSQIKNSSVNVISNVDYHYHSSPIPIEVEQTPHLQVQDVKERLVLYYLKQYSQLPLVTGEGSFPIEKLETNLAIANQENKNRSGLLKRAKHDLSSIKPGFGHIVSEITPITPAQFFDSDEGKPVPRILLLGEAGVGKSALCQKIVYSWANGELFLDRFKALFYLPVNLLNLHAKLHKILNPTQFFARAVAEIIFGEPELTEALLHFLKKEQKEVLILIDGYDEACTQLATVLASIFPTNPFHSLVTLRPRHFDQALLSAFSRKVSCLGFTDTHAANYWRWFFDKLEEEGQSSRLEKKFKGDLLERPQLAELVRVPLHLQMLCSLWIQGEDPGFTSSLTELYMQIVHHLINLYYKKQKRDPFEVVEQEKDQLLIALGKIGKAALEGINLTQPHLSQITGGYPLALKSLLDTGLLKSLGTGLNTQYRFSHPTFQEYLIAYAMSKKNIEEQKAFILAHGGKTNYQGALVFLFGIPYQGNRGNVQLTQDFFSLLCQSLSSLPSTELCRSIELVLRCLNECLNFREKLPAIEQLWPTPQLLKIKLRDAKYGWKLPIGLWLGKQGWIQALNWLIDSLGTGFLYQKDAVGRRIVHCAALEGRLEMLDWLRKKNSALLQKTMNDGSTAMHLAVQEGHTKAMEWLHQKGPTMLQKTMNDGFSVMHLAAQKGDVKAMQWLYDQDYTILQKAMDDGTTAMHFAAQEGQTEAMEWLHQKDPKMLPKTMDDGWTTMHAAAQHGQLEAMKWLHQKDPTILQKTMSDDFNAMHAAASKNQMQAMQWLHQQDPTILQKAMNNGATAMHVAAQHGQLKAMQWLHQQDPTLLQKVTNDGSTTMHLAAVNGHVEAIKWLYLQDHTLLQKTRNDGWTAMHLAAVNGHVEAMQLLHQQDPTLLQKATIFGLTATHAAAQEGHVEAMQWLHQQDPTFLQKAMNDGWTAIHAAAQKGHVEAMQWLHQQDPTILQKAMNNGATAMHVAAEYGHVKAMQWLHQQDSILLQKATNDGWTAMHFAALNGQVEAMQWLHLKDPNLLHKATNYGLTAMNFAAQNGHSEAMQWLQKAMNDK